MLQNTCNFFTKPAFTTFFQSARISTIFKIWYLTITQLVLEIFKNKTVSLSNNHPVNATFSQNPLLPLFFPKCSHFNNTLRYAADMDIIWTWTTMHGWNRTPWKFHEDGINCLDFRGNKHNAELWKTAPAAKVSCHKCSGQKGQFHTIFFDTVLKIIFKKKIFLGQKLSRTGNTRKTPKKYL